MNKKNNIKKHVNIHIITLVVTIMVVAIMDALKLYSISVSAMIVFIVGYTLYIVVSSVMMISKNSKENENKK